MFRFADAPVFYQRLGLGILLVQLCLFVFTLPPFEAGLWMQVEPVMLVLFLFAALACAWLAAGVAKRWLKPLPYHPLWLGWFAWVGWQLVATACATSSWRSWFGPPDMGEGASWHVSMLALALLAYPCWQVESYRRIILWTAAASLFAQCVQAWFFPSYYQPGINAAPGGDGDLRWPKHLVDAAGYGWIAVMSGRQAKTGLPRLLMVAFMGMLLATAFNRTADVLLGSAMLLVWLLPLRLHSRFALRLFYPGRFWRTLALLACLLPFGWVALCAQYGALRPTLNQIGFASLQNKEMPMGSRIELTQVALSALMHEPWRLVAGDGWGRFTDDVYKYALLSDNYIYHDGIYHPSWSVLYDIPVFHSHDQPLEALLSLGLPGMLLWFVLPALLLWHLPPRYFWNAAPMLVAMTMYGFFWFEVAQSVPFRALALVSLCSLGAAAKRRGFSPRAMPWVAAAAACVCLAMGWSAWQQWQAMRYGETIKTALFAESYKTTSPDWLADDVRRGGDRLREAGILYEMSLARTLHAQPLDDTDRGWYALFLNASDQAALTPGIGPRVSSLELWLQYKLMTELASPALATLQQEAVTALPDSVLLMCKKAPLRDDVATAFLANLTAVAHNDKARELDWLNRMLALVPDHRGALWVKGTLLRQAKGSEAEGEALQKRALLLGVERVYPVTDKERAAFNSP